MRADKAIQYLKDRPGQWIPITTDETRDAMRELRKDGHDISMRIGDDGRREVMYTEPQMTLDMVAEAVKAFGEGNITKAEQINGIMKELDSVQERLVIPTGMALGDKCMHPSESRTYTSSDEPVCRDCGQILPAYMMGGKQNTVPEGEALTPGQAGRTNPLRRNEDGTYEVAMSPCPECGENMAIYEDHVRASKTHLAWANGGVLPDEVGTDPALEVKDQPVYMFPVDWDRKTQAGFEMGQIVTCPRCIGKLRPRRQVSKKGVKEWVDADTFTHDPDRNHRDQRCMRCNGHGVVPNVGPVESAKLEAEATRRQRMEDPG